MSDVELTVDQSPVELGVSGARGSAGPTGASGPAGTSSTAVWKDAVVVALDSNVTISAPGSSLDGLSMTAGDRVLLLGQTDPSKNGIYNWNSAGGAMTRAVDMDASGEFNAALVPVRSGSLSGSIWFQKVVDPTVDTTPITFIDFMKVKIATTLADLVLGLQTYEGDGSFLPLIWGNDGGVLLGYNTVTGYLEGAYGIGVHDLIDLVYRPLRDLRHYEGDGSFIPIVWGNDGGVVLGFNTDTGLLEGAFSAGSSEVQDQAEIPLSGADLVTRKSALNWNGFISYGQSLSEGAGASAISTTAVAAYNNKTFGGGPQSGKPSNTAGAVNTSPGTTTVIATLEAGKTGADGNTVGESCCTSVASFSNLIAMRDHQIPPSDFVSFVSAPGHGSYSMALLEQGSTWYNNFKDHITEAKARAIAAGVTWQLDSVGWMQGETEAEQVGGVDAGLYAYYKSHLKDLCDDINSDYQSLTGYTNPVHLLTYVTASNANFANDPLDMTRLNAVQLAQQDAAAEHARIHLVTPIYHLFADTADGIHLGAIGQVLFGRYMARARMAILLDGVEPKGIKVVAAYARGQTLEIQFDVPKLPLVIDPNLVGVITDNGFKVVDGTGTLTLSNIRASGNFVRMELNRALGTSPKVRYGLDYVPTTVNINDGGAGSLRDSTLDTYKIGSTTYNLPYVCPYFEQAIIPLESI